METKEEWINKTFESIRNLQGAELSTEAKNKIIKQAMFSEGKVISMRPVVKWVAAASILILFGFNIVSIVQHANSSSTTSQIANNPFYNEYFSFLNAF